jgi:Ni/Co efflux regulator RcnB
MKRFVLASAAAALILGAAGAAAAQPGYNTYNNDHRGDYSHRQRDDDRHGGYDNRSNDRRGGYDHRSNGRWGGYDNRGGYQGGYQRHNEWRSGYRMQSYDWNRGHRIDYRAYRLRAPPYGYEWREVDGNYVMAAIATGLIASIIAGQY